MLHTRLCCRKIKRTYEYGTRIAVSSNSRRRIIALDFDGVCTLRARTKVINSTKTEITDGDREKERE